MMRGPLALALGAGAVSLAALAVLMAAGCSAWAVAAWVAMAIPGLVGGARLAHLHGNADGRFIAVMGAGALARMLAAATVSALAAREGSEAIRAALLGLAAGFVPIAAFETVWFVRRGAPRAARGGGA